MKKVLDTIRFFFAVVEILVLFMLLANVWVFALTNGRTYTKISKIPPRETALVLGTSPRTMSGNANPYFIARMDAAALLYHHGKINRIIVSGEKSRGYDEPTAMKNFLIYQEGVPEHIITKDSKGFSTKASIKRCDELYQQRSVIIVSQGFHNLRALFLARSREMNALGFDAQDITHPESYYRNQSREFLARVQAVLHYLFGIE